MIQDTKLSGVIHILLHLAEADSPLTSETMAAMMRTNPAVIRRILAGLRKQGLVSSEKGHGGGWQLSCDLNTVTLHDIYIALDSPALLAIGNRTDSPICLVEQAVNTVMNQAFHDAEALLLARFGEVTLATLSKHVQHHREERRLHAGGDQAGGYSEIQRADEKAQGQLSSTSDEQPSAEGAMAGSAVHRSLMVGEDVQHGSHAQTGHLHHGHHGHGAHQGHRAGHHHLFTGIERWLQALENPERDQSQRPADVIASLELQHNDVVADIGAGTGYFALRIAETFPQVRVLAADAQPEMVEYLRTQSQERNLANLEPVMIDPIRPELPVQAHLALLVNTLHHIDDRVAYLTHLTRSMARGARIAVIDYRIEAAEGPPADHRISAEAVRDELRQAGYALEQEVTFLPNQYFLIFKQA